mmetsp:Transcript_103343/g.267285  ORF Transcript_103343/g.267285 Transcript_103343/m.267285 type:complete len:897 (-) Transcript_103343:143-2833(-)
MAGGAYVPLLLVLVLPIHAAQPAHRQPYNEVKAAASLSASRHPGAHGAVPSQLVQTLTAGTTDGAEDDASMDSLTSDIKSLFGSDDQAQAPPAAPGAAAAPPVKPAKAAATAVSTASHASAGSAPVQTPKPAALTTPPAAPKAEVPKVAVQTAAKKEATAPAAVPNGAKPAAPVAATQAASPPSKAAAPRKPPTSAQAVPAATKLPAVAKITAAASGSAPVPATPVAPEANTTVNTTAKSSVKSTHAQAAATPAPAAATSSTPATTATTVAAKLPAAAKLTAAVSGHVAAAALVPATPMALKANAMVNTTTNSSANSTHAQADNKTKAEIAKEAAEEKDKVVEDLPMAKLFMDDDASKSTTMPPSKNSTTSLNSTASLNATTNTTLTVKTTSEVNVSSTVNVTTSREEALQAEVAALKAKLAAAQAAQQALAMQKANATAAKVAVAAGPAAVPKHVPAAAKAAATVAPKHAHAAEPTALRRLLWHKSSAPMPAHAQHMAASEKAMVKQLIAPRHRQGPSPLKKFLKSLEADKAELKPTRLHGAGKADLPRLLGQHYAKPAAATHKFLFTPERKAPPMWTKVAHDTRIPEGAVRQLPLSGLVALDSEVAATPKDEPAAEAGTEAVPKAMVALPVTEAPTAPKAAHAEPTADVAAPAQQPTQPAVAVQAAAMPAPASSGGWFGPIGSFFSWLIGSSPSADAPHSGGRSFLSLLFAQKPTMSPKQDPVRTAQATVEAKQALVEISDDWSVLEQQDKAVVDHIKGEDAAERVRAETPSKPQQVTPTHNANSHVSNFWSSLEGQDADIEASLTDGHDLIRYQQLTRMQDETVSRAASVLDGQGLNMNSRNPLSHADLSSVPIHDTWSVAEKVDRDEEEKIHANPDLKMIQVDHTQARTTMT